MKIHNALTIAGSDSGGGAGIQADLKAFSALGVYGASIVTAVTAQNTRAVTAVHAIPDEVVRAQLRAVFDDLRIDAIKIGMLGTPSLIASVADELTTCRAPIVLDPVMVAKSGDRLLPDDAIVALVKALMPRATVVTPNLPEVAALLDEREAPRTPDEMRAAGERLLARGARAVLVKGGHLDGAQCVDLLMTPQRAPVAFEAPRFQTRNTHGTGCTLSSAIAAGLAKGLALETAVREAHAYLRRAILAADDLEVGSGHGPVQHFHNLWSNA